MTLRHGPNFLRSEKCLVGDCSVMEREILADWQKLIDHDFAETGVWDEEMVLLDLEHRDMRSLTTTSRIQKISKPM